MVALWIVIGVVVAAVAGWLLFGSKVYLGNRSGIDRLRRHDPEAAARLEAQRAEQAIRGMGAGGGLGGGGGFISGPN